MPNTARGFRYPASSDSANVQQYFQNLASDVDSLTKVPVVASIAARNAHGTPYAGKQMLVAGNLHTYDGSAWRFTLSGPFAATTDPTTGTWDIAHGAGQTPTAVSVTLRDSGDTVNKIAKWLVQSVGSTNIQVRAVRTDTSAYFLNNPVNGYWWAQF